MTSRSREITVRRSDQTSGRRQKRATGRKQGEGVGRMQGENKSVSGRVADPRVPDGTGWKNSCSAIWESTKRKKNPATGRRYV